MVGITDDGLTGAKPYKQNHWISCSISLFSNHEPYRIFYFTVVKLRFTSSHRINHSFLPYLENTIQ